MFIRLPITGVLGIIFLMVGSRKTPIGKAAERQAAWSEIRLGRGATGERVNLNPAFQMVQAFLKSRLTYPPHLPTPLAPYSARPRATTRAS